MKSRASKPTQRVTNPASRITVMGIRGRPVGKLHTMEEVAEILGLSKRSVQRLVATGALRVHRLGRAVRVSPKLLVEDVNSGKWDISFVAQDPDRERILNFTTVYLSLEHGYLVPSGSPIQTINDVDRAGIRVGVPAGGSVIAPLKRTLKDAQIIEVGMPEAADLVQSGKVDVFAANKANLFAIADRLPGSRVLEGRFSVDRFALGLPKGREAGLAYERKFIENAKSEGLVKSAAERAGVRGAVQE
jgi:excisionase family DNA binding protein